MTQEQIAVRISTVALIAALAMMFALALAGCAPANQCQTILYAYWHNTASPHDI